MSNHIEEYHTCRTCKHYDVPLYKKPCLDCIMRDLSNPLWESKKANYKKSNVSNNGGYKSCTNSLE